MDERAASEAGTKQTSLAQAAEVLDGEAGHITARWVERLQATIYRMNAVIQDLVDVTRLEAGQLRLSRRPVDLRAFLLDLLERRSGTIARERIRLQAPEQLSPVYADLARLEHILMALLTNALQYSRPDTKVAVRLDESSGTVITSVQDHGPGVPPDVLPRLFDRLKPMSEPGLGGTFSFSLPVANRLHQPTGSTDGVPPAGSRPGRSWQRPASGSRCSSRAPA